MVLINANHALSNPYATNQTIEVSDLETNATSQPLGIDDSAPRFTWKLVSDRINVEQAKFQLLVASKPELLKPGRADIWDSKVVKSSNSDLVYSGRPLKSRTRYYWTVQVRTTDSALAAWATQTFFETAFLNKDEWRGQWISGPERSRDLSASEGQADDDHIRSSGELCRPTAWLKSGFAADRIKSNQGECREIRPTPLLRKSFMLSQAIVRARLYSAGLAYNALS